MSYKMSWKDRDILTDEEVAAQVLGFLLFAAYLIVYFCTVFHSGLNIEISRGLSKFIFYFFGVAYFFMVLWNTKLASGTPEESLYDKHSNIEWNNFFIFIFIVISFDCNDGYLSKWWNWGFLFFFLASLLLSYILSRRL